MTEQEIRTDERRRVIAEIREEANELARARARAERAGSGRPSAPVSAHGARAVASWLERGLPSETTEPSA